MDNSGLRKVIDGLTEQYQGRSIDKVVGIESRGFFFAPSLAYNLNTGFVPVRKKGKLPAETVSASYELEYGEDILEMHKDAIAQNQRVLIVDDLIATGGTAAATARMVRQLGGEVVALAFIVELEALNGAAKLEGYEVFSMLKY